MHHINLLKTYGGLLIPTLEWAVRDLILIFLMILYTYMIKMSEFNLQPKQLNLTSLK